MCLLKNLWCTCIKTGAVWYIHCPPYSGSHYDALTSVCLHTSLLWLFPTAPYKYVVNTRALSTGRRISGLQNPRHRKVVTHFGASQIGPLEVRCFTCFLTTVQNYQENSWILICEKHDAFFEGRSAGKSLKLGTDGHQWACMVKSGGIWECTRPVCLSSRIFGMGQMQIWLAALVVAVGLLSMWVIKLLLHGVLLKCPRAGTWGCTVVKIWRNRSIFYIWQSFIRQK